MGRREIRLERLEKVKEMYAQNKSEEEMALELGLAVRTIKLYISKLGVKKKEREETRKKIADMYTEGYTRAEIVHQLGVKDKYIDTVIRSFGMKTRRRFLGEIDLIDENTVFAEEKVKCETVVIKGKPVIKDGKKIRENKVYTDITQKICGI